MQIPFDVLRALTVLRQAGGASEADAATWAQANLDRGTQLAQGAVDAASDPLGARRAALQALKDLAQPNA